MTSSCVSNRREKTGLVNFISNLKILATNPKLSKYSVGQAKHLCGPDLGLLFSTSVLNCLSFWS
jgi:hypothetical protein